MFAAIALFGAAYTLKVNEHVRIDIVYGAFPSARATWIDVFGHAVLSDPRARSCMVYLSWPCLLALPAAATRCRPMPAACRAGRSKLLIPLAFTFVLLQGFSELIKCIAIIRGDLKTPCRRRPSRSCGS